MISEVLLRNTIYMTVFHNRHLYRTCHPMTRRYLPDTGFVVPASLFGHRALGVIDAASFRVPDFECL